MLAVKMWSLILCLICMPMAHWGTVRTQGEFTCHDVVDDDTAAIMDVGAELPFLAGIEAQVATQQTDHVHKAPRAAEMVEITSCHQTMLSTLPDHLTMHTALPSAVIVT